MFPALPRILASYFVNGLTVHWTQFRASVITSHAQLIPQKKIQTDVPHHLLFGLAIRQFTRKIGTKSLSALLVPQFELHTFC
jgi:hypothetical protein